MIDEFEERSAIMEFDGALPRPWADALARLCTAPKPSAYLDERWEIIVEDACGLMVHLPKIVKSGWSSDDVKALLPHLKGRPVKHIGMGEITVAMSQGEAKIYRRPTGDGSVYWTEGRRA